MQGVRAVFPSLLAALALTGCMHATGPVAVAQPQSDLDYMAYGQPYTPAPPSYEVADSSGGGAISALRNAFAASPQRAYAPRPAVYAAAPMPVAYEVAYKLDAGDKLRVVVYGQEGLTNTYAIDAGGAITMPLIGAVAARAARSRRRSPPRSRRSYSAHRDIGRGLRLRRG